MPPALHDAVIELFDGAIETLSAGDDDEAVHAVRKSCKRIRAALRLLRGRLGAAAYRRNNRRVRDAARPLMAARDALILRQSLARLRTSPLSLQRRLEADYRRKRRDLERRGARIALAKLIATRKGLVQIPRGDLAVKSAVMGAAHVFKTGRNAFHEARSRDDKALHELRKQVQYLFNQLDLLKAVCNARLRKLRRRANRLASLLGDDHDMSLLMSQLRAHAADHTSALKQLRTRRCKLQARALRKGRKLYRHSAKQFTAIMAAPL